jgi:hypothetical protein
MTFSDHYFETLDLNRAEDEATIAATDGTLAEAADGSRYEFSRAFAFKSPSAAGSVILNRRTNWRTRWYQEGSKQTYHEWQDDKASPPGAKS